MECELCADVGSSWNGEFGPQNMMQCLVGNNYINHNYYQIDPDAVICFGSFRFVWMSGRYTVLHYMPGNVRKLYLYVRPASFN